MEKVNIWGFFFAVFQEVNDDQKEVVGYKWIGILYTLSDTAFG